MKGLLSLVLCVVCSTAFGQFSNCPGGVCPVNVQTAFSVPISSGHWTYPGEITNHLEADHGVSARGLSLEEKLTLHDQIHEGRVTRRVVPEPYEVPTPYVFVSSVSRVAPAALPSTRVATSVFTSTAYTTTSFVRDRPFRRFIGRVFPVARSIFGRLRCR